MSKKKITSFGEKKPLTAIAVGRYLKKLSLLNSDVQTGNPALGEALQQIANILVNSNERTVLDALSSNKKATLESDEFKYSTEIRDFSFEKINSIIEKETVTKKELTVLGSERFGISESRLNKLPRDGVIKAIKAALEHERSIKILSDEAKREGQSRTS